METKNTPGAIPNLDLSQMKAAAEGLANLSTMMESLANVLAPAAVSIRATAGQLLAFVEIQRIGAKAIADMNAVKASTATLLGCEGDKGTIPQAEAPNPPATRQSSVHHQAPTAAIDAGRVAGAPKRASKDVQ